MHGSFSERALQVYAKLAAEKTGLNFAESGSYYDFTRCVRPDGSAYGTSGRCRKGVEGEKPKEDKPATNAAAKPEQDYDKEKMRKAYILMDMARQHADLGEPEKEADFAKEAAAWFRVALKGEGDHEKLFKAAYERLKEEKGRPSTPATTSTAAPVAKKEKSRAATSTATPISKAEATTLRNYIMGGSMETGSMLDTNMKLRGVNRDSLSSKEKKQISDMDSALQKLPQNTSGQTHYRGFYLDPSTDSKLIQSLKVGATLKDPGFSSYSRDKEQAEEFADQGMGRPFVIVTKNKGLRDVRRYAPEEYEDQQESILPRGTALKIDRMTNAGGITYLHVS